MTVAAMESTSTYWKGAFYALEEEGMEVWLVNAAHIKVVPGHTTDVRNGEWNAQLLEQVLLRPSFVPPDIRRLRMLTRYRQSLRRADRARQSPRRLALPDPAG